MQITDFLFLLPKCQKRLASECIAFPPPFLNSSTWKGQHISLGKKPFLINWNVCTHNCQECLTFALMRQQCIQQSGLVLSFFFFFFHFPACFCITGIQITGSNSKALRSMGSDHPVHKSSQRLGLSKGKLCCIFYLLQGTRLWETVLNQSSNFPQTTGNLGEGWRWQGRKRKTK